MNNPNQLQDLNPYAPLLRELCGEIDASLSWKQRTVTDRPWTREENELIRSYIVSGSILYGNNSWNTTLTLLGSIIGKVSYDSKNKRIIFPHNYPEQSDEFHWTMRHSAAATDTFSLDSEVPTRINITATHPEVYDLFHKWNMTWRKKLEEMVHK